jgi:AraC family transcriptional regulator
LSQAAERLLGSRSKIIEIAFDYQFNSPESFSRAFKKMFAVQPKQYRKRGSLDRRRLLTELDSERLDLMSRAVSLIPERTRLEGFTLSALMSPIQGNTETVAGLWEDLDADLPVTSETDASSLCRYFGIAGFPRGWNRSGFYYSAAVPRKGTEPSNPALVLTLLPAGEYARFTFKAKIKEMIAILEYVFQTWLPKSQFSSDIPFVILSYGSKPSRADDGEIDQQVFVPLD